MMSDVCKHCVSAACLEVCPTGAIIRTEFDTVVIQSDACNGCRDCIAACPFGVIHINPVSSTAQKCTFCYDRLQAGLEPACAKACPTDSIQFGPIAELRSAAAARVEQLQARGEQARTSTAPTTGCWAGSTRSTCWWISPRSTACRPTRSCRRATCVPSSLFSALGALVVGLLGVISFRTRGASAAARDEEVRA